MKMLYKGVLAPVIYWDSRSNDLRRLVLDQIYSSIYVFVSHINLHIWLYLLPYLNNKISILFFDPKPDTQS